VRPSAGRKRSYRCMIRAAVGPAVTIARIGRRRRRSAATGDGRGVEGLHFARRRHIAWKGDFIAAATYWPVDILAC